MTDYQAISQYSVNFTPEFLHTLNKELAMSTLFARWVPKLLTDARSSSNSASVLKICTNLKEIPPTFWTGVWLWTKLWIHAWNKATAKAMEASWPTPSKVGQDCPVCRETHCIILFYFDAAGILLVYFLWKGHTVTGQYHVTLLWQLRDDVIAKCLGKLTRAVLFYQDNAPAHKSPVTMTVHNCGFELVDYPLYSPDLAPWDFQLFSDPKKNLMWTHFAANDAFMAAAEALLNKLNEVFQAGVVALQQRWEKWGWGWLWWKITDEKILATHPSYGGATHFFYQPCSTLLCAL